MKYCIAYPYLGESRTVRPFKQYPPSAVELLQKACEFFGFTIDELGTKSRKGIYVDARQMVMAAMYQSGMLNLSSIGTLLGNRDHTTVIHARDTVKGRCEVDMEYKYIYDGFLRYLNLSPVPDNFRNAGTYSNKEYLSLNAEL